ncbi:MAG: hypothetical protein CM15mP55_0490 [Hyphomicrobiales bacterium]|nr:MAG: hypothetical protein CM15mP55_0490 [Hyphomicrobiales bacterium]
MKYEIFTDGHAPETPAPAGGVFDQRAGWRADLCGGAPSTTNNQMELMAAIEALARCRTEPKFGWLLTAFTSRTALQAGLIIGSGAAGKQPPANRSKTSIVEALDAACARHTSQWVWVKGHAGNAGNEHADALARRAWSLSVQLTQLGQKIFDTRVQRLARILLDIERFNHAVAHDHRITQRRVPMPKPEPSISSPSFWSVRHCRQPPS